MVLGLESIGNAFERFFDFLVLDIFTPFWVLIMVAFFFGVQYLFVRFYMWLFTSGVKGFNKALDWIKLKDIDKRIEKFFD